MRRALIGLSSPIGYNFSCEKQYGRPNPVLDAPWGIFVFYDEVWFLTRELCPFNVEALPFVHFVDEEYNLSRMDLPTYGDYHSVRDAVPQPTRAEALQALSTSLRLNARPGWAVDREGPILKIGSQNLNTSPHPANLLIDDYLASELGFDLITNTQTSLYSKKCIEPALVHQLSQQAISDVLPNVQELEGPYHPIVDELRSIRTIKAFRQKMESLAENRDFSELSRLRSELEAELRDFTARTIEQQMSRWKIFLSGQQSCSQLQVYTFRAVGWL